MIPECLTLTGDAGHGKTHLCRRLLQDYLGYNEDEARELYDTLLQHMSEERFCYRHRWQAGDVLMSDNRCSLHRASEWDEAAYVRRLHRIIMVDDRAPS